MPDHCIHAPFHETFLNKSKADLLSHLRHFQVCHSRKKAASAAIPVIILMLSANAMRAQREAFSPDIKDINRKQDFRNGTFVTLERKYFSKPL